MSLSIATAARAAFHTPFMARSAPRFIHSSVPRWTSVGYGDPPEEKAANYTPTPQPSSRGQGQNVESEGGGDSTKKSAGHPDRNEVTETKKIGENPKKEEVGGAGPVGG